MVHLQKTGYLAIALLFVLPLFTSKSDAVIISDLSESIFTGATIEVFSPETVQASTFDFENGMTFSNLLGDSDFVKFNDPGGYGLGDVGTIFEGRDADAYFGTLEPLTSFSFDFVDGINGFGFFGGESVFRGDVDARDGFLDLDFYDLDNFLLGSVNVDTNGNTPFDTFYGFGSTGSLIGSVHFTDVGHMVLDDVQFGVFSGISEPASTDLIGEIWDISFESRRLDTSRIGLEDFDIWARWTYKVTALQSGDAFSHIAFGLPDAAFGSAGVLDSVVILDASGADVTSSYDPIQFRGAGEGSLNMSQQNLEFNNQSDLLRVQGDFNIIMFSTPFAENREIELGMKQGRGSDIGVIFGPGELTDLVIVPTLTEWGIILLILTLAIAAVFQVKRQQLLGQIV